MLATDCTDRATHFHALLETLLTTQRPALVAMVAPRIPRRLRSLIAAEDVVQEASLEALSSVAAFRHGGEDSLRRWVWRIARHRLSDLVKAQRRLKRGARTYADCACRDDASPLDAVAANDACPSAATTSWEDAAALRRALAGLPPAYRHALQLRHMEGLSVGDVAARLGRSPRAVQMLCNRGVKLLRRALAPLRATHRSGDTCGHLNGDTCERVRRTSIERLTGSFDPGRVARSGSQTTQLL